jgi:hypothetical protein
MDQQEQKNWQAAKQVEIEKLTKKVERMRQIGTTAGFYKAYYDLLPKTKTYVDAFNQLNDEYFELFGVYRYSSYNTFRKRLK